MSKKHKIFFKILCPPLSLFLRLKLGYTYTKPKELPEQYIVLSNHNTDYDPILVGVGFGKQMYFVASEHISRWKNAYKFIKFVFDPIMRYKGSVASSTVLDVLRKIRSGENVCIFAEGARSWDGITNPILPSTGKMVKSAKCALITYKIVGGYFASPNWSTSNTRKGYLHGSPVNIYTKEQLEGMSVDEINECIKDDLYEDAYARQLEDKKRYKGKNLAEKMENVLFVCPKCKKIDTIKSHGDTVSCTKCDMSFTYDEYGMLHGIPYSTVKELYAWEKDQVKEHAQQGVIYTAKEATLSTVKKHEETLLSQGELTFSKEELVCDDVKIPFSDISELAMHGRHALVFTANGVYYELIVNESSNALKFALLYETVKNQ